MFYLHNKDQFFDPNSGEVFGSFSGKVLLKGCNRTVGCHRRYDISRIEWKAMNNKGQPCDETGASKNTRQCISNFIRDRVGCYIPLQDMEPGGKPKCQQLDQFHEILNLTLRLSLTDSDLDIYKITGCLSSCKKVSNSIRSVHKKRCRR